MTDLEAILSGYFAGGTVPSKLYIGLVKASSFVAFDPVNDEMSSHPGWSEFTDYDETDRQEWIPGVVVGDTLAQTNNPTPATITPNVNDTVNAIFLCDDPTKGGSSGQLYGPWYFEEGIRDTFSASPFRIELTIFLRSNTPTVS